MISHNIQLKTLKNNSRILALWLILFISPFIFRNYVSAQDLQFNTLTVNDGLTQHDVSCIMQDSYGFIWVGTYDGLNRYDGLKILNFSHKTYDIESLSSNIIIFLF